MTKIFSMKQSAGVIALALFISSVIFNIRFQSCYLESPLAWDETDYAGAAQSGIINNAFERHSLSLVQFAQLGLAKAKNKKANVDDFPPESTDPFQLRHFHP